MEDVWEKAAMNLSHYKPFLFVNSKPVLLFPGLVGDDKPALNFSVLNVSLYF